MIDDRVLVVFDRSRCLPHHRRPFLIVSAASAATVNVARADKHPGRFGNIWIVGKHGTRAQCAAMFYQTARGFISLGSESPTVDEQLALHHRIKRNLADLSGHDIACWCALDGGACHGDVLLALANPGLPVPAWFAEGVDLPRVRLGMAAADIQKLQRAKRRRERAELDLKGASE